jgi:hypothetical protein
MNIELDLVKARRRADECMPFSPSWAGAIEMVEDLERQLWVLDRMIGQAGPLDDVPRERAVEPYRPAMELAAAR